MDKDKIIQITNKLYNLTLLFPKKEPLRYKMREIADNIVANFIDWEISSDLDNKELTFVIEKDLEILNGYFEIAKAQNWVSFFDILEIEQEYGKIMRITKEKPKRENKPVFIEDFSGQKESIEEINKQIEAEKEEDIDYQIIDKNKESLDSRKERILEILKEKGRVQVGEVSEILPQVSKRTIRRDFVNLLEQGLIERIGEKNHTFYQLKPQDI